jgi:hypothetical protein
VEALAPRKLEGAVTCKSGFNIIIYKQMLVLFFFKLKMKKNTVHLVIFSIAAAALLHQTQAASTYS